VRHGGAATTATSLDAGQGSGNIDKTPSMPYDSPLLRVNTLGSDECSMSLQELTVLCITLSQKFESLKEDLKQTKQVYGAAYTKLIMKVKRLEKTVKPGKARRTAQKVAFDDEKEYEDPSKQGRSMIKEIDQDTEVTLVTPTHVSTQGEAHSQKDQPEDQLGVFSAAKVLADAAKVHTYSRRRRAVSTGIGEISTASRLFSTAEESVSTASASMPVSTTGMIQEVNIAAVKDKEEGDKYSEVDQAKMLVDLINQRKRYFNELFKATMRSINDFVLMESGYDKAVPKLADPRSLKRDAKEELEHKGSKKQKTSEASRSSQEQPGEEEKELSQKDLQQLMIIVTEQGMNVKALQTKYPIIDLEIYTQNTRKY
nr:hypothetical protein [Tanacetum cinerariifolium]